MQNNNLTKSDRCLYTEIWI